MTSAHVVKKSVTVTYNSPFQDYPHPDDHTTRSTNKRVCNFCKNCYCCCGFQRAWQGNASVTETLIVFSYNNHPMLFFHCNYAVCSFLYNLSFLNLRHRVPAGRVEMAGNASQTTRRESFHANVNLVTLEKLVKQVSLETTNCN